MNYVLLPLLTILGCGASQVPIKTCDLCSPNFYSSTQGCAVRWHAEDLPLLIQTEDPLLDADTLWAINYINLVTQKKILSFSEGQHVVKVSLKDELATETRIGQAFFTYYKNGGRITKASIDIKEGLDPNHVRLVILHELGHILGLLHTEPEECSVMTSHFNSGCPHLIVSQIDGLKTLYEAQDPADQFMCLP